MDLGSQLVYALLLSIPVACISWTVACEEVFREVREALQAFQRQNRRSWWRQKLAYLPTCPYCFSHYVAACFMFVFDFRMLVTDARGYLVSLFTLVLISNVYISGYNLLRVMLRRRRALADLAETEAKEAKESLAAATEEDSEPIEHLPYRRPRNAERNASRSKKNGRTVRFPEVTRSS